MVTIKEKKKKKAKRFNIVMFGWICLGVTTLLYLGTSLFLRDYNNKLSAKRQSIEAETARIEMSNDNVKGDIQTLSTRDRIDNIADENGLRMNQDNIVTITANSDED